MSARSANKGTPPIGERDRGAVLVEAAIVVPLLLFLTFGIWTTARAWNVHNTLDHASREAARRGAVTANHSNMSTTAQGVVVASAIPWGEIDFCSSVIRSGAPDSMGAATTTSPCIQSGSGEGQDPTTDDRVQVTLTYEDYALDFLVFEMNVDLRARAVARLERGT